MHKKWRIRHVRGIISAPSKVTVRFKSSWSDAMRTLGTRMSQISRAEKTTRPVESVDEEMCDARTLIGFL